MVRQRYRIASSRLHSKQEQQINTEELIPSLNKETWEYLEFRIWNSFSKKIWILLASVLTVASLLGLLGMDAWMKSRVDKIMANQKESFDVARKTYLTRVDQQLRDAALLFILENRLHRDEKLYKERIRSIRKMVTKQQWKVLMSKNSIANVLWDIPFKEKDKDLFMSQIAEIRKTLDFGPYKDTVPTEIENLRNGNAHIQALRFVINQLKRRIFEKANVDSGALILYYEKQVYPEYYNELRKRTNVVHAWSMDEDRFFNFLEPSASRELKFYVPSGDILWDKY